MQPIDELLLARTADHIAVGLIGTFVVWLGYKLFRDMPARREGESKITLPGGVSILLSRVGPGIFFALFGTGLIGYIVHSQVAIDIDPVSGRVVKANGLFTQPVQADSTPDQTVPQIAMPPSHLIKLLADIARINDASDSPERFVRETALREARARLMLQSWQPAWGDREAFRTWIFEKDAALPAPKEAAGAATVYQGASLP